MSNSVLIVEKDLVLMKELREGLKGRGFEVDETTDGKGAPELIRKKKPGVVVLAVDLEAPALQPLAEFLHQHEVLLDDQH